MRNHRQQTQLPGRLGLLIACLLVASVAACGKKKARRTTQEVVVVQRTALPKGPTDAAWNGVPTYDAKLLLQDIVEPRQLKTTTPKVQVQAITDGRRIALRLAWPDRDVRQASAARSYDRCHRNQRKHL